MKNRAKRLILCLAAVSVMTASGSIPETLTSTLAVSEENAEEDNSAAEEQTEEAEEEEKEDKEELISAADAQKLMHHIGTADGYDVYSRGEDYQDGIWSVHGGNPKDRDDYDKNAEPSAEELAAEAEISLLKKAGEFVIISAETGETAASFSKKTGSDDSTVSYISDSGRFLLTLDKEESRAEKILETVSAEDEPCLFRSEDGLVLTDSSYRKELHRYTFSRSETDKNVYCDSENENFVWLSADETQVTAVFRYAAENDAYRLLVDDRTALLGLENKENGCIWWSSPLGAARDGSATPVVRDELRSSNVLRYGVPEDRSVNNVLRSSSEADCTVTVSDIENGVRAVYSYPKAGISYPVDYTLGSDYLDAYLPVSEITESDPSKIAAEVTLLGSFGAASSEESGKFLIPDGCGAAVHFNNNYQGQKSDYMQRIYGADTTAVPLRKTSVTEQLCLPVYGIMRDDGNSLLVTAVKGDTNALLSASVSGQSGSSFNLCSFTFILRSTDTFYMSGNIREELTAFERGGIKSGDIEVRYYPLSGSSSGYAGIAERYRRFLTEEKGVEKKAEDGCYPLYADICGGVMKKKSVLGIPMNTKMSVTDFSEAEDILRTLKDGGVDDMTVTYDNWTNSGIRNRIDRTAKPSGTLGGSDDFRSLTDFINDSGYTLYPVSDSRDIRSGTGILPFSGTCVRVSGAYSKIVSYDRAYGVPDGFRKDMSLLSPSEYADVLGDIAESYSSAGLGGVSLGSLTSSLYGDYSKHTVSRAKAAELLAEGCEAIGEKLGGGILASQPNACVLPYVSCMTDIPLSSGGSDIFDEDVPFYQLVMHGLIPYSTEAVNGSADIEQTLLMAAATGSSLSFDLIGSETSRLRDTEYDKYFYADRSWTETASAAYRLLSPVLSKVSGCTITDYEQDGSLITTTYSDGTVTEVDLDKKTISCGSTFIDLEKAAEEEGLRF